MILPECSPTFVWFVSLLTSFGQTVLRTLSAYRCCILLRSGGFVAPRVRIEVYLGAGPRAGSYFMCGVVSSCRK
jgi:hypothetical protein